MPIIFNTNFCLIMSMFKEKAEFRRAPSDEIFYDSEETIRKTSRKTYLEDMKIRIEKKTEAQILDFVTIGYDTEQSLYQGELDDLNCQLERPMMPVRTQEELFSKIKRVRRYHGGNNLIPTL